MSRFSRRSIALVSVAAIVGSPAGAVVGGLQVAAGPPGNPIPQAKVQISFGGTVIAEAETDSRGRLVVPLEEGAYDLSVTNGARTTKSTVTIEPGSLSIVQAQPGAPGFTTLDGPPPLTFEPDGLETKSGFDLESRVMNGVIWTLACRR